MGLQAMDEDAMVINRLYRRPLMLRRTKLKSRQNCYSQRRAVSLPPGGATYRSMSTTSHLLGAEKMAPPSLSAT
jgi:hypothetical protein